MDVIFDLYMTLRASPNLKWLTSNFRPESGEKSLLTTEGIQNKSHWNCYKLIYWTNNFLTLLRFRCRFTGQQEMSSTYVYPLWLSVVFDLGSGSFGSPGRPSGKSSRSFSIWLVIASIVFYHVKNLASNSIKIGPLEPIIKAIVSLWYGYFQRSDGHETRRV